MFAPLDGGATGRSAGRPSTIGDRFGRIYDNPYDAPEIQGVKLDFDLVAGTAFGTAGSLAHRCDGS